MPVFKVWGEDRKVTIMAETIEEVKRKGLMKLHLPNIDLSQLRVELEDGTEIDEDDILIEYSASVLRLIPTIEQQVPVPRGPVPQGPEPQGLEPLEPVPQGPEPQGPESQKPLPSKDEVVFRDYSEAAKLQADIVSTPPTLSKYVHINLQGNNAEKVWVSAVNETAEHYYRRFPLLKETVQYQAIGEMMWRKYPSIAQEGTQPWSLFTKNVSQKIRHLRFNAKKKSMTGSSSGVVKKKFKPTMPEVAMTVAGESDESESELETAEHLREIARIWGKQKVTETDMADTKQLLKATVKSRMQLLKDHPDGRLAPVMKKYPCFTDGSMIIFELKLRIGQETVQKFARNLKLLVKATASLLPNTDDDLPEMKDVFFHLSKTTQMKSLKNKKDTFIQVLEDVPDDEVFKHLKTKPMDPLHCKVFRRQQHVTGCYIIGDSFIITCSKLSMITAVYELVAAYYVFNVDYPKIYAMPMAAIQEICLEQPYRFDKSKQYKFFSKNVKAKIKELEKEMREEEQ